MLYVIAESSLDSDLHLTLAPAFTLPAGVDPRLMLTEVATNAIRASAKCTNVFTSQHGESVIALEMIASKQLLEIHNDFMDRIEKLGGETLVAGYTRDGYTPHVTWAPPALESIQFDRIILSERSGLEFTALATIELQ